MDFRHSNPFQEIHVANFASQQREERYPDPEKAFFYSNADHIMTFHGLGMEHPEDPGEPPRIALWRSNLVALSQNFNLYFAAYRDKIYCYIPQDLKQTIPGKANLILDLPQTQNAILVGGYINDFRPHCVNHMIVGSLGNLEVLLMACDDGDVIAYYTHLVIDEIKRLEIGEAPISKISPFFQENVSMSAWGLAIHQKSCLIAVSSNLRVVTLFAHSIAIGEQENTQSNEYSPEGFSEIRVARELFPLVDAMRHPRSALHGRGGNYKLILELGEHGDNIPSIDFASRPDGEAEAVLAGDINGNLWILDIWGQGYSSIPGIRHSPDSPDNKRAWGILSLPLQNFKMLKRPHEALGLTNLEKSFWSLSLNAHDSGGSQCFDITPSVSLVKHASKWHPKYEFGIFGPEMGMIDRSTQRGPELLYDNSSRDDKKVSGMDYVFSKAREMGIDIDEVDREQAALRLQMTHTITANLKKIQKSRKKREMPNSSSEYRAVYNYLVDYFMHRHERDTMGYVFDDLDWTLEYETQVFRLFVNLPPSMRAKIHCLSDLENLGSVMSKIEEEGVTPTISTEEASQIHKFLLPDHSAILRCYGGDIELLSPNHDSMLSTICSDSVKQKIPRQIQSLVNFDRLNLLASIPELSLVVVGSQIGRVSLITLTKLEDGFCQYGPMVMFRLDYILPFKHHEDAFRPHCPLLGMAVSPLQKNKMTGGRKWPRRWRLIMHYYDHTILSYELGREEENDQLLVI